MNWDTKIVLAHAVQKKQSHQGHHIGMIHPSDEGKELTSYISSKPYLFSLQLTAKKALDFFCGNGCRVDFLSVGSCNKNHLQQPTKSPTVLGCHLKNAKHVCGGGNVTPPPPFSPSAPSDLHRKTPPSNPSVTPGHSVTERMGFFSGVVWAAFIACFGWPMSCLVFREGCGQQILNNYLCEVSLPKKSHVLKWGFISLPRNIIWVKQLHLVATRQSVWFTPQEKTGTTFFTAQNPLTWFRRMKTTQELPHLRSWQ